jgi:hypothetical protein
VPGAFVFDERGSSTEQDFRHLYILRPWRRKMVWCGKLPNRDGYTCDMFLAGQERQSLEVKPSILGLSRVVDDS